MDKVYIKYHFSHACDVNERNVILSIYYRQWFYFVAHRFHQLKYQPEYVNWISKDKYR